MLIKTTAIVIKTTRFSETSIIAKIYTHSHGMLSFHIPGVFSAKSSFNPSLFQPLQIIELDFYFRENKNLMKIKEVKNTLTSKDICSNIIKTTLSLAISEIIYKTIREEEQNEKLYDFCFHAIKLLNDSSEQLTNFFLVFSTLYTRYIGFYPEMNYTNELVFNLVSGRFGQKPADHELYMSPEESNYFNTVLNLELKDFYTLKIPLDHRREIVRHVLSYYEIHVNGFNKLNSYEVLLSVFH